MNRYLIVRGIARAATYTTIAAAVLAACSWDPFQ